MKYDLKQIAFEIEQTALNKSFYGNALRVAKDIDGLNADDRSLLDSYLTGGTKSTHHIALQELANKIRGLL